MASSYGISFMEPSGWRWRGSFGRVGSFAWWKRLLPMMHELRTSSTFVSSSEMRTSRSSQDEPQYGHPTPVISFGMLLASFPEPYRALNELEGSLQFFLGCGFDGNREPAVLGGTGRLGPGRNYLVCPDSLADVGKAWRAVLGRLNCLYDDTAAFAGDPDIGVFPDAKSLHVFRVHLADRAGLEIVGVGLSLLHRSTFLDRTLGDHVHDYFCHGGSSYPYDRPSDPVSPLPERVITLYGQAPTQTPHPAQSSSFTSRLRNFPSLTW